MDGASGQQTTRQKWNLKANIEDNESDEDSCSENDDSDENEKNRPNRAINLFSYTEKNVWS